MYLSIFIYTMIIIYRLWYVDYIILFHGKIHLVNLQSLSKYFSKGKQ